MAHGVRFLHIADVHIGFRVTRFDEPVASKLREARFQALDNAIRVAEDWQADFILIAGDLFDDNGVSLTDAQRAFSMLAGRSMPVYILPGNHDPYCAGSVWQRRPWAQTEGTSIHLLSVPEPVVLDNGVALLPCPVTRKRSAYDPTAWIGSAKTASGCILVGLAHGSVMDRQPLPEDDHPIPPDAPLARGLDYLALGHWHEHKPFRTDGAIRMAYPGTSEQMGFVSGGLDVGWRAYSPDPMGGEFIGGSKGSALLVALGERGAPPVVEQVDIGHYAWLEESANVTDESFGDFFSAMARRGDKERHLLRLTLSGVLSVENMVAIEGFRNMLSRYLYCELNTDDLHIRPDAGAIADVVGGGLLGDVWKRLESLAEAAPPERRRVTEAAMLVLYQLAKGVQA